MLKYISTATLLKHLAEIKKNLNKRSRYYYTRFEVLTEIEKFVISQSEEKEDIFDEQ